MKIIMLSQHATPSRAPDYKITQSVGTLRDRTKVDEKEEKHRAYSNSSSVVSHRWARSSSGQSSPLSVREVWNLQTHAGTFARHLVGPVQGLQRVPEIALRRL